MSLAIADEQSDSGTAALSATKGKMRAPKQQ
jgi:hypothetical protein